ncbi:MAG: AraC family transcriptional regulator [Phaeodactylibacter sp.]|nr:AraC family transcriptional regulator [Phaeodactylibacter sp.]MCB9273641.1 AraC family transcriptional regulator [Lewinellaceae bacterium]
MLYQELQPHPSLRAHIACYFFMKLGVGAPPEELVFPDGTPGLMIIEQARFTRYCPLEQKERRQLSGSYLFGQKARPVHYAFDTPGFACFGVKFQPPGLRVFTTLPAFELTDTLVEAAQLLKAPFRELENKLLSAPCITERKALLDEYFIGQIPPQPDAGLGLVQQALAYIHRRRGQLDITELSEKFQLNYKALERLFKKYVGLTPKAYCCLTRFNATLLHRQHHQHGSLTRLAYDSGYFDQMHFIREVKQFTNLRPGEFYPGGFGKIGAHQQQLVAERLR